MSSREPDRTLTPRERATIRKALRLVRTCQEGGVYLEWLQHPAYGDEWRAAVLAATVGPEGRPLTDASVATWEAVALILETDPKLAGSAPLGAGTTLPVPS